MLARIRKSTEDKDQGFTLIELLVVIVIIGILAAIAIPTFLNQRQKGWDSQAKSDARNMQIAVETEFVDAQQYPAKAVIVTPLYKQSETPTAWRYEVAADSQKYCVAVTSKSAKVWVAGSDTSGVVEGTCSAAGVAAP